MRGNPLVRRAAVASLLLTLVVACSSTGSSTQAPDGRLDADEPAVKCDPDDPEAECLELADNAIRLDDEAALGVVRLEKKDDDSVELELAAASPLRGRIVPGVTLVRGRHGRPPVLRTVAAVEGTGNVLVLRTTAANLRDGYKKGRIKRRTRFDDAAMLKAKSFAGGLSTQAGGDGIEFGLNDCSRTLVNQGGLVVSLPECRFVIGIDIDMDWSWGKDVVPDSWEMTATGSIDARVLGRLQLTGSGFFGSETSLLKFPDIPIPGLPITIGGELIGGYGVTTTGSLTAEAGFAYEAERTVGFGWRAPFNVYDVNKGSKSFTPLGPTITGTASMVGEIYVKPVIEVKALGVIGGFAALKLFASLGLAGTADGGAAKYCYDLSVGLTPSFGLTAGVLGLDIIKTEWDAFTIKTSLANKCVDATSATTCKATDNCRVDSDCPAKNACSISSCTTDCLCKSTKIEGCCLNDADCEGGPFPAGRTCQDNKCKLTMTSPYSGSKGGKDPGKAGIIKKSDAATPGEAGWEIGPCSTDFECSDFDPETIDQCTAVGCITILTSAGASASPNGAIKRQTFETGRSCQTITDCDVDGDPSTAEVCREQQCRRIPLKAGDARRCLVDEQCDDGDAGTRDLCVRRRCKHVERPIDPCAWRDCDDNNPLTEDACVDGECKHRDRQKP